CERSADNIIYLLYIQAIVGYSGTVVFDIDLGKTCYPLYLRSGRTFYCLNNSIRFIRINQQTVEVFSEYLNGYILPDTCHQLIKTHLYRLIGFKEYTGNNFKFLHH